jgi:NADP-dependent 3-hydroxy acid dehydrogenase YdfG
MNRFTDKVALVTGGGSGVAQLKYDKHYDAMSQV